MKFTPIARCAMRASPSPGGGVSSAVHSSTSGPPAVRARIAMSVTHPPSSAGSLRSAGCARTLRAASLVRRETQAHETRCALAESAAVEHRYALRAIQLAHEIVPRQAGAAHIDQHEHAGIGRHDSESGRPSSAASTNLQRSRQKSRIRDSASVRDADRRERRLLNESRQAVQHADRERLGVGDQRFRADQPAGAPAGHGMRLRQAAR